MVLSALKPVLLGGHAFEEIHRPVPVEMGDAGFHHRRNIIGIPKAEAEERFHLGPSAHCFHPVDYQGKRCRLARNQQF
jgi:hypothetical protein